MTPVRYLALDAMGVIYEHAGIAVRLAAFACDRGARVSTEQARAAYVSASRGAMTSAQLWEALGIPGDHDAEFLAGRTLMPGAAGFLAGMAAEGLPVGAITNDVAEWSAWARHAQGVAGAISPWVVSGEVGARKPARAIYDVFLSTAGCRPEDCLFVDDQEHNLAAAEALGFQTAWFAPGRTGRQDPSRGVVGSFAALFQLVNELVKGGTNGTR